MLTGQNCLQAKTRAPIKNPFKDIIGTEINGPKCLNANECELGQSLCLDTVEACVDTPGSYTCKCADGYERIGSVCEGFSGLEICIFYI